MIDIVWAFGADRGLWNPPPPQTLWACIPIWVGEPVLMSILVAFFRASKGMPEKVLKTATKTNLVVLSPQANYTD
jgi:hypothetical protein